MNPLLWVIAVFAGTALWCAAFMAWDTMRWQQSQRCACRHPETPGLVHEHWRCYPPAERVR